MILDKSSQLSRYPLQPQDQYKPQLAVWCESIDGLTEGERGVGFGE